MTKLVTVSNSTATGANTALLALKVFEPIKRAHRQLSAMASLAWWQVLAAFEHVNQFRFVISNETG